MESYKALIIGGTSVVSLAVGSVAGYFFAKKQLEQKYADIADEEITEAKRFYSALQKKRYETPEDAVADLVVFKEAVEAVTSYSPTPEDAKEELLNSIDEGENEPDFEGIYDANIFENRAWTENPEHDFAQEVASRDEDKPYVLSHVEFLQGEQGYDQTSWVYYAGDGVLADERDGHIDLVKETVGDCLERFGHWSEDQNKVYVRNNTLAIEIEILYSSGSYRTEVMGLGEAPIETPARRMRIVQNPPQVSARSRFPSNIAVTG